MLIVAGDLSRAATRQYWLYRKSGWIGGNANEQEGGARAWDLWDGWRVLQLMKEHGVGVRRDADGVIMGIDEGWFDRLPRAK